MSSLRKLHGWDCKETGQRMVDNRPQVGALESVVQETALEPAGFGVLKEYRWVIQVGTTFTATDAEFNDAQEVAAKRILHFLYSDMERHLLEAAQAAYSGDFREVLRAVNAARDLIEQ